MLGWLIGGLLALVLVLGLADKLPGVRYVLGPLVRGVSALVEILAGTTGAWILWAVKATVRAHVTFVRHLVTPRAVLDRAEALARQRR